MRIETIARDSGSLLCGRHVTVIAILSMIFCTMAFQMVEARAGALSLHSKLALAAAGTGWNPEDIDVFDSASLNRNECEFFSAAQKRVMDAPTVELAKLPDGTVVSSAGRRDNRGAATILKTCGTGATASWWAEIILRFGGQMMGQLVHGEADAFAVREIERRGATFHPPAFDVSEGNIGLSFFAVLYEPIRPLLVVAKLSPEEHLEVVSKPVD